MSDKAQGFSALLASDRSTEAIFQRAAGLQPAMLKMALSAVAWFLAVAWLYFADGIHIDLVMTTVTGFFVMLFTLILVAASG